MGVLQVSRPIISVNFLSPLNMYPNVLAADTSKLVTSIVVTFSKSEKTPLLPFDVTKSLFTFTPLFYINTFY
ncbi:hypothetical protein FD33_GL000699 [Companilactobacillus paralimentarius DSM 13238 = JCM 10415]|uniref:Uncharacterized protein n=1 Tax=Companilactobacillus paralimentarius DSM 13238 = JCM 10415 TaxID=1122151 RepID=A0A0R1PIZ1_9LACO|nr:hypothetical protein FD33_GL000699 [Companilactobacillus paralimentarius DSM 13238 = JCM 10415]